VVVVVMVKHKVSVQTDVDSGVSRAIWDDERKIIERHWKLAVVQMCLREARTLTLTVDDVDILEKQRDSLTCQIKELKEDVRAMRIGRAYLLKNECAPSVHE
jgi:hypothetical protein